jgi:hypothetical protein
MRMAVAGIGFPSFISCSWEAIRHFDFIHVAQGKDSDLLAQRIARLPRVVDPDPLEIEVLEGRSPRRAFEIEDRRIPNALMRLPSQGRLADLARTKKRDDRRFSKPKDST